MSILSTAQRKTQRVQAFAQRFPMVCEIYHHLSHVYWAGFYQVTAPEVLAIGPYQGSH